MNNTTILLFQPTNISELKHEGQIGQCRRTGHQFEMSENSQNKKLDLGRDVFVLGKRKEQKMEGYENRNKMLHEMEGSA